MKTKVCTKCGERLPETAEFFPLDRGRLKSRCRECCNQYYREYHQKNREAQLERFKEHYRRNKNQYQIYKRRYYEENKEQILADQKAYYEENAEIIKVRMREYRKTNPDYKKCIKRWKQKNRATVNAYNQKRKARKRRLPATLTPEQWKIIKEHFNNSCAYCGESEDSLLARGVGPLHQEHFVSLVKGGGYTYDNIIPACVSCNSSKNDSDFFEWYPSCVHYSKEREKKILDRLGYQGEQKQFSLA